jgi:hypothetical protein
VDRISRKKGIVLGSLLLLVVGVAYLLNSPLIFPQPYIWIRIAVPLLLLGGFLGGVLGAKPLLIAGRIGGWFFLLVVIRYSVVSDWDASFEAGRVPHGGSHDTLWIVLELAAALLVLLCIHSRTLRPSSG